MVPFPLLYPLHLSFGPFDYLAHGMVFLALQQLLLIASEVTNERGHETEIDRRV